MSAVPPRRAAGWKNFRGGEIGRGLRNTEQFHIASGVVDLPSASTAQNKRRGLLVGFWVVGGVVAVVLLVGLGASYTLIYRPLKGTVVDAQVAAATYARVEIETSTGEVGPLRVEAFVRLVEELAPKMKKVSDVWGDGPSTEAGVVRSLVKTFFLNRALARLSLTHAQALEREGMRLQEYIDLSNDFQSIFTEEASAGASGGSFDCWQELQSGENQSVGKAISLLFRPSTSNGEVAEVLPERSRLDEIDRSQMMQLTESWCRSEFEALDISQMFQAFAQSDPRVQAPQP